MVHDTNLSPAMLRQHALPWHAQLARASASFRLVFEHHTLYSSGPNADAAPLPELRALLAPLYTASGVDVVFGGHEHFYERTRPIGGVVYVTSGAGGAALYPRTTTNPWSAAFVNDRHGYTYVELGRRSLKLRQMDVEGAVLDSMTLTRAVSFADPLRVDGGAAAAPRGWTSAGFDDSGWSAALGAPGRLRARRAFWLEGGAASEALLRVHGLSDYQVWLNEAPVARGGLVGDAPESFELDGKRLRRGPQPPRDRGLPRGGRHGQRGPRADARLARTPLTRALAARGARPQAGVGRFAWARCLRYSTTAGITETTMIARITRLKFFFTNGRLPKK